MTWSKWTFSQRQGFRKEHLTRHPFGRPLYPGLRAWQLASKSARSDLDQSRQRDHFREARVSHVAWRKSRQPGARQEPIRSAQCRDSRRSAPAHRLPGCDSRREHPNEKVGRIDRSVHEMSPASASKTPDMRRFSSRCWMSRSALSPSAKCARRGAADGRTPVAFSHARRLLR